MNDQRKSVYVLCIVLHIFHRVTCLLFVSINYKENIENTVYMRQTSAAKDSCFSVSFLFVLMDPTGS